MLQVLHMGLHVCQIMGYGQINDSINLITNNSAKTLNILDQYGMEEGKPGNLIILPAENPYDAIRRQVPVVYSIRKGKVISKANPRENKIFLDDEEEIDFRK